MVVHKASLSNLESQNKKTGDIAFTGKRIPGLKIPVPVGEKKE